MEIQENHEQFQLTLLPLRLKELTYLYGAPWTISTQQQGTNPYDSSD